MNSKHRSSEKVTKADLYRGIRHLTRAVRQLTAAQTLLRLDLQTALGQSNKTDER
jgi:hypothetical protein